MRRTLILALGVLALGDAPTPAHADDDPTLRGSPSSMLRQNQVAREHDFSFLRSPSQVRRFVEDGHLVPVEPRGALRLASVSFPYARPAMRLFLERLAAQYRDGCGEDLVVTSLMRPTSEQPGNAHPLSVHPTGMAVDLRVSRTSGACVEWLEHRLLALEREGLLDVTREHRPPHFHVALFPSAYREHVTRVVMDSVRAEVQARRERLEQHQARNPPVQAALRPAAAESRPEDGRGRRPPVLLAALSLVLPLGIGAWRWRRGRRDGA